jgi:hypothetical protein
MRVPWKTVLALTALMAVCVFAPAQVNVSSPAAVKDLSSSAIGSAAPSNATYAGGNSSGNLAGIVACDSSALSTISTATTTQIVALVSGKSIYICGLVMNGGGTTTAKLVYGTGTNCATGLTSLTPAFTLASGTNLAVGGGLGYVAKTITGNALCVTNSAAATANVFVAYTQF